MHNVFKILDQGSAGKKKKQFFMVKWNILPITFNNKVSGIKLFFKYNTKYFLIAIYNQINILNK